MPINIAKFSGPVKDNLFLEIARGEIGGFSSVCKFGTNFAVGASLVDVWEQGISYTFTTTAQNYFISSSDNGDTEDIVVEGLDADFNLQTIIVTLAGQTKTKIATSGNDEFFIRTFRAFNVGSTDLAGDVYIYEDDNLTAGVPDTASKIRAKIDNTTEHVHNQTLMAIYTIPNGKTGYMFQWFATGGEGKDAEVLLRTRAEGGVFRARAHVDVFENNWIFPFIVPLKLLAKTDIKISAVSSAVGTTVNAGFDLILIDN